MPAGNGKGSAWPTGGAGYPRPAELRAVRDGSLIRNLWRLRPHEPAATIGKLRNWGREDLSAIERDAEISPIVGPAIGA